MKRNIGILVLVVAALTAGAAYFTRPSTAGSASVKSTTLLQPTNSKDLLDYVKQHKAKVTLINFWASWCEPCKQEFPFILQVRKELADKGLNVVFVSLDEQHDLGEAQAFLTEQHVDFPTFYKGDQPVQMVGEILPAWQGAIPTTALIDTNGTTVDWWEGDASLDEFRKRIGHQLEGK